MDKLFNMTISQEDIESIEENICDNFQDLSEEEQWNEVKTVIARKLISTIPDNEMGIMYYLERIDDPHNIFRKVQ